MKKIILKTRLIVFVTLFALGISQASADNTGADLMNSVMGIMKEQGIDVENPSTTERDLFIDQVMINASDTDMNPNFIDISVGDETANLQNSIQSVIQELSREPSPVVPPRFEPTLPEDLIVGGAGDLENQSGHTTGAHCALLLDKGFTTRNCEGLGD